MISRLISYNMATKILHGSICKFILSVLPVHLISSKSCYMLPVPCRVIHSEPSSQLWFGDMNQPIGLGKHKAALLPG